MRNIIITICALALTFTLACDDGGDEGVTVTVTVTVVG